MAAGAFGQRGDTVVSPRIITSMYAAAMYVVFAAEVAVVAAGEAAAAGAADPFKAANLNGRYKYG